MGSKQSHRRDLTEADIEILVRISEMPRSEIQSWFTALKSDCPSLRLGKSQFIKFYSSFPTPRNHNPVREIAEQCFNVFDVDKNGWVDLGEFLMVYVIMNGTDAEEKLKYAFSMYDQDNNGFIDERELREGLQLMFRFRQVNESEASVKKIMAYLDENKDGRINKTEFMEGLLSDPYLIKYTSPYY